MSPTVWRGSNDAKGTWAIVRWRTPARTGNQVFSARTSTSAVPSGIGVRRGQLGAFLRHPAARELARRDLEQLRLFLTAAFDRERAARLELACRRKPRHVGRRAFDWPKRFAGLGIEARDRLKQRPSVRVTGT